MDEKLEALNSQRNQFNNQEQVIWVPIRHHSPACSYYLLEILNKHNPDIILIEGAIDYTSKISAIVNEKTLPPIAIYSKHLFFPLCNTSPEYQALMWGEKNNKDIRFIDLPIDNKAELNKVSDTKFLSEQNESQLQHNEYVNNLVKKFGCRSSDELWERIFELKKFDTPEQFFEQVFDYCASSRLTYSNTALLESGDISRESYMKLQISGAVKSGKKCCVITGGFHTPALLNYQDEKGKVDITNKEESETWLIRYSDDRLDALNGYSAGMQAPMFYDRLFHYRMNKVDTHLNLSDLVFNFIDDITCQLEGLTLNTFEKISLCNQIIELSSLRNNAFPGLFDVKDAIQSVLIKCEINDKNPTLFIAHKLLAGNRLGTIGVDQPTIPLISDLFNKLKVAKFKLDNTVSITTKFSLYNLNENSKRRHHLLNQCLFLDIGFAQRISGPNWELGYDLERLTEEWKYAWTPWVEANLIDQSIRGSDWDSLILNRVNEISEKDDVTLSDMQGLFVQLTLMGCLDLVSNLWPNFLTMVQSSTDPKELVDLIQLLVRLTRYESGLLNEYKELYKKLILNTWNQLLFSLPSIGKLDQIDALKIIIQTQEVTRELIKLEKIDWRQIWENRLNWLIEHGQLTVAIKFACKTLLVELIDTDNPNHELEKNKLIVSLEKLFELQIEDAYYTLQAVLIVAPNWFFGKDEKLLLLLNEMLNRWDNDVFLSSLPDLRFIFSHIEPKKLERISQRICQINDWENDLEVFNSNISTQEILDAQESYQKLISHLEKEGLEHWIKH
ncbi:MAG: DUF5682 family protein [Pseudomonadales bacterium]|nr:DUF5682 family protein [Pseudomonadales bacterium]